MQEYTVQRGDNLTKIARKFGIDNWRKIWNANRDTIPNPNVIKAGQKIKIPGGKPVPPPTPEPNVDIEKLMKAYFGLQIAINDAGINVSKKKTDAWSEKFNEIEKDLIIALRSSPKDVQKSLKKEISTRIGQVEEILIRMGGRYGGESKISLYQRARKRNDEEKINDAVSSLSGNVSQNDLEYFLSAMKVASKFTEDTFAVASKAPNVTNENKEKNTMNKIFENYFKQNLTEEAEVSTSDPEAADIADIVVDEVNAVFEDLPDDSPLKNREVALAALAKIKAGLPAMIQGLNIS